MTLFYLGIPTAALALWPVHAWWSWRRPDRLDAVGWLLLVGLPLAAVVTFVVFGFVEEPQRSQNEVFPPGEHGDLRFRQLVVFAQLVATSLVVCALEVVLMGLRAWRRERAVSGSIS